MGVQDLATVKAGLEGGIGGRGLAPNVIDQARQRCIDGVRRMCADLRPSLLDDLGLVPALEWLLAELEGRVDIHTSLVVDGKLERLDPERELAIFRIAQEALRNVERHARARNVWVRLACENGEVKLTVEDDGQGFIPGAVRNGCLGLTGMTERARLIAASLQIESRPGHTVVQLLVPVPKALASDAGSAEERVLSAL